MSAGYEYIGDTHGSGIVSCTAAVHGLRSWWSV